MGPVRLARLAFAHPGLRGGGLRAWPAHMALERMGGNAVSDLAIHLVDAARHLLGPVRGMSCNPDIDRVGSAREGSATEAQGQATLLSEDGALVHVWASAVAPRVMLTMHVVCENGEVGLDGGQVTRRNTRRREGRSLRRTDTHPSGWIPRCAGSAPRRSTTGHDPHRNRRREHGDRRTESTREGLGHRRVTALIRFARVVECRVS